MAQRTGYRVDIEWVMREQGYHLLIRDGEFAIHFTRERHPPGAEFPRSAIMSMDELDLRQIADQFFAAFERVGIRPSTNAGEIRRLEEHRDDMRKIAFKLLDETA
jgi:hypothetical protein